MKHYLIPAILLMALIHATSCKKMNTITLQEINQTSGGPKGPKEDDNPKIAMKVINQNNDPLEYVTATLTNGNDTVQQVSGADGIVSTYVIRAGEWHVRLTRTGHFQKDTIMTASADTTLRVIHLQEEQ